LKTKWDDIEDRRTEIGRAYGYIFTSEMGQIVLEDIRKFCGVGRDAYTPGTFDQTAYNLGMQRVWLHIDAKINSHPIAETLHTTEESLDE